jgi:hypothetical protein
MTYKVGKIIGLSERAVEGRIYRFKRLVRDTLNEAPTRRRRKER